MNNDRNESENKYDNLSPMFFVPVLLKEGNYNVSPFHGLLDELLEADIRRIGKDFVYIKEKKILDKDLSKDIKEKRSEERRVVKEDRKKTKKKDERNKKKKQE